MRTKLWHLTPSGKTFKVSPQDGPLLNTFIVCKVPLSLSFALTATNFSVCNSKTAGDAHHRSSYAGPSGRIRRTGALQEAFSQEQQGKQKRAKAISYCTLLHLHFYEAFCIVQLCQIPGTHTQWRSLHPPCPRKAGGQKAQRALGKLHLKPVLVTDCPHLTCSNTYFTHSHPRWQILDLRKTGQ